mgnify:CR=1 FL=1
MDEVHEHFDSIYVLKLADLAWSPVLKDDFYGNFGFTKNFSHRWYFELCLRIPIEKTKMMDEDKINHLFYPLNILQKVLAELRKNSTSIYFSPKLMLERIQNVVREFCKDTFLKMLCLRIPIGKKHFFS